MNIGRLSFSRALATYRQFNAGGVTESPRRNADCPNIPGYVVHSASPITKYLYYFDHELHASQGYPFVVFLLHQ